MVQPIEQAPPDRSKETSSRCVSKIVIDCATSDCVKRVMKAARKIKQGSYSPLQLKRAKMQTEESVALLIQHDDTGNATTMLEHFLHSEIDSLAGAKLVLIEQE